MKHVTSFLYLTLMLICSLLIPTTSFADNVYQSGKASWYGSFHHGRKTASGERFNMNGLSAAHRTLPLGSMIEVTNKDTGKSVTVKVNDRGPYHGNRILDLSKGAASQLGMLKTGVGNIQITVLSKPEPRSKRNSTDLPQFVDVPKTSINPGNPDVELMALNRQLKLASGTITIDPPEREKVMPSDRLENLIASVEEDPLQRLINDIDRERLNTRIHSKANIIPTAYQRQSKMIAMLPTDMF